jgi:hypothetical protein
MMCLKIINVSLICISNFTDNTVTREFPKTFFYIDRLYVVPPTQTMLKIVK